MTSSAQTRLEKGYAARSTAKPPKEESPEMEQRRAELKPSMRMSVGYARIRRENER